MTSSLVSTLPSPSPWQSLVYSLRMSLFCTIHIKHGIRENVAFVCGFAHGAWFSRFIRAVVRVRTPLPSTPEYSTVRTDPSIHSSARGRLDYMYSLAIMTKAATNIHVQAFAWTRSNSLGHLGVAPWGHMVILL